MDIIKYVKYGLVGELVVDERYDRCARALAMADERAQATDLRRQLSESDRTVREQLREQMAIKADLKQLLVENAKLKEDNAAAPRRLRRREAMIDTLTVERDTARAQLMAGDGELRCLKRKVHLAGGDALLKDGPITRSRKQFRAAVREQMA